jgi:hypothetical protein
MPTNGATILPLTEKRVTKHAKICAKPITDRVQIACTWMKFVDEHLSWRSAKNEPYNAAQDRGVVSVLRSLAS